MSTYILQKDLPDVKAGEMLKWGDAINAYYIETKTPTIECKYKWPKHIVENDDGTWFKLKEEKIKVISFQQLGHEKIYQIMTNIEIPTEKYGVIMNAILFIVNEEKCCNPLNY